MLRWLRPIKKAEPTVIGYGKGPGAAEFFRVGTSGFTVPAIEDWVSKVVSTPGYIALDDAACVSQKFLLPSQLGGGQMVAGVITPSRDSAGRRYPLLIASTFPADGFKTTPHLLPTMLAPFLEKAGELLGRVTHVRSPAEFHRALDDLHVPAPPDPSDTSAYEQWTRDTTLSKLFGALPGDHASQAAEAIAHTLLEATAPFRGLESPSTTLAVRLPLVAEVPHLADFWIDLTRRCAGWRKTIPAWFAPTRPPQSILVLLSDVASANALINAWESQQPSNSVCDLTRPRDVDSSRYAKPLPPHVAALLHVPTTSLAELLVAI